MGLVSAALALVAAGRLIWALTPRSDRDDNVLYVVDGACDPYVYRMVPFPSDRYWASRPD